MSRQPKPDASFASTRLTRANYSGPPLLSQVGGRSTRSADKAGSNADANGDVPAGQGNDTLNKSRPEPATEDEPMSSSDESEDSILSPENKRRTERDWSPGDLGRNFAAIEKVSKEEAKQTPKRKRKIEGTLSRRGKRRAGRGSTTSSPDNVLNKPTTWREERILFSGDSRPKRPNQTYRSKTHNIHSSAKAPGSKDGYKEPKKEFIMPASEPNSSDPMVHSSQISSDAPTFKNPLFIPDELYSSSQPTTNSHGQDDDTIISDVDYDPNESYSSLGDISDTFSCDEISRPPAYCPMCKKPVDHEMLDDFLASKKNNTREQRRFCDSHKRKSAEQEWQARCYPIIDWEGLDERIGRHFENLESILRMESPSFYRKLTESSDSVKKGAFRLTAGSEELDRISPGYYGARGSKKMMDAIISRFSSDIRRLSASDKLMQTTGVSGFIQTVLVPELTVMLVKEDMDVDDETARRIMKESEGIGDLLNEQPDDHVEWDPDKEYELR